MEVVGEFGHAVARDGGDFRDGGFDAGEEDALGGGLFEEFAGEVDDADVGGGGGGGLLEEGEEEFCEEGGAHL